jgi:hypothetical protein
MLRSKLQRLGLMAGVPTALTLLATSVAHAQYPYYNTFDDATTISTVASYNPPPIITRFDYGNGGPSSTNSTGWSNAEDHTGNGGGSVMQSITFSNSPVAQQGAFTLDIAGGAGINVSNVSFYIMLAPGSAVNSDTSAGDAGASSGFFGVAIRNGSYDYITPGPGYPGGPGNPSVNGTVQTGNGWNFGDPNYTGTSDQGTWEFVSIPLGPGDGIDTSTGNNVVDDSQGVRALTFSDYDDDSASSRKITGTVTWYIDDLTLTQAVVPEPATLGLLALSVPALMLRRRKGA